MKKRNMIWVVIVIIVLLIVAFFIPKILRTLYLRNIDKLENAWRLDDLLNYVGQAFSAVVAAAGIGCTIYITQQNSRQDKKNSVKPFISISALKVQYENVLFSMDNVELEDLEHHYKEYLLDEWYYVIDNGIIKVQNKLNSRESILQKQGGAEWIINGGMNILTSNATINVPLLIKNAGKGIAAEIRIGFNKKDSEKDNKYLEPRYMDVKDTVKIHIFCAEPKENDYGEYVLEFIYQDMNGIKYKQSNTVKLYKENEKTYCEIELGTNQVEV